MLTVLAPAKINLTLEVLGKRPDDYHRISSVMQTIDLCDRLRFRAGNDIEIESDYPEFVAGESLTARAAALLRQAAGSAKGARIDISKRIPLSAGLGGDSSDAAAVLRGLNRLWGLGLPPGRLAGLAVELGSDVPFFLDGGTALAQGRGERLTRLEPLRSWWVVVVVPAVPRPKAKTRQLYASLEPAHFTEGQITGRMVDDLATGRFAPPLLFNTFENVAAAQFPGLEVYRQHLAKLGASDVHLAGSGPALFTMLQNRARAEELHARCRQQGLETYLARTLASVPGNY